MAWERYMSPAALSGNREQPAEVKLPTSLALAALPGVSTSSPGTCGMSPASGSGDWGLDPMQVPVTCLVTLGKSGCSFLHP